MVYALKLCRDSVPWDLLFERVTCTLCLWASPILLLGFHSTPSWPQGFLHLRCIINPCLWRGLKSLRLRLSSEYFVMLVGVFQSLWPCRSLIFEGACNRNILSGWAEAREALQVSLVKGVLLVVALKCSPVCSGPWCRGASCHLDSQSPSERWTPGARPVALQAASCSLSGMCYLSTPLRIPSSSLALMSVTCPGLASPSGRFWGPHPPPRPLSFSGQLISCASALGTLWASRGVQILPPQGHGV